LWEQELGGMRDRIKAMRSGLVAGLAAAGVTEDMSFITDQVGMFSYSGLTKDQMVRLRSEFGVYGTDSGRLCIAALNDANLVLRQRCHCRSRGVRRRARASFYRVGSDSAPIRLAFPGWSAGRARLTLNQDQAT
jgi:hypothetical protein